MYGGTKAELERLIKDAASYTDVQKEMGVTIDASSMSFDNIVNAISVVQGKLGIAGATALEAGTTIEGSVNSMKAAWQNLLTGVADDNADFEGLVNDFVTTIAGDGTESNLGVIGNILPRIEIGLNGAAKLIENLFPVIMDQIPSIIENTLPKIAESAFHIVETIVNGVLEYAPELLQLAVDILIMLAEGIAGNVEQLTTSLVEVILKIVEVLTNPESLIALTGAALNIILGLAAGIIKAIPQLLKSIPKIIEGIVVTIGNLLYKITEVGKDIVNGIWQGIKAKKDEFTRKVKDFFSGIVDGVKSALGIHSPSRVFAAIGRFMADGLGEGWEDEFSGIKKLIDDSLIFDDPNIGISASVNGANGAQVASGGNVINITFNGVQSSDPQEFMEYIARELQKFFERRELIYG